MYIDPGLGSIIIQIIVGSFIAVPVIIKVYGKRIKAIFKRENNAKTDERTV